MLTLAFDLDSQTKFILFLMAFGALLWRIGSAVWAMNASTKTQTEKLEQQSKAINSIQNALVEQTRTNERTNERLAQVVHSLDGLTESVKQHGVILREHDERLERMERSR